jgi:hypothetical protein
MCSNFLCTAVALYVTCDRQGIKWGNFAKFDLKKIKKDIGHFAVLLFVSARLFVGRSK